MRLTATQLEFLQRLGKTPEGQQLKGLIKAQLDDVSVDLRKLTGEALYRAQGVAVYLDEQLAHLNRPNAPPRDLSSRLPTAHDLSP